MAARQMTKAQMLDEAKKRGVEVKKSWTARKIAATLNAAAKGKKAKGNGPKRSGAADVIRTGLLAGHKPETIEASVRKVAPDYKFLANEGVYTMRKAIKYYARELTKRGETVKTDLD